MAAALDKFKYFEQTGYEPHAGQRRVHLMRSRFKVLRCGRRWGKTLAGGKECEPNAFVLNRFGDPQRWWIVGPNYIDAEKEFRVIYDSLRKLGVDRDAVKFVNNPDSGNMHITTSWGFDLQCRSAAKPETLVGEGLDGVLIVEAGRQRRATWAKYVRPALSDKRGGALISGVPEGSSEHSLLYALHQRGQTAQYTSWASIKMPSWTNTVSFPGGRRDPEILEAESDLTEQEFQQQYGAEFVDGVGAVMQEWDDDFHLADLSYRPGWETYGACDYGFTNPFVWLWIQVGPFGEIRVLRERRWQQLDTAEIAADMLSNPVDAALIREMTRFYPDPAEPDDSRQLSRIFRKPFSSNTGGELKTRLSLIRRALKPTIPHLPIDHVDQRPTLMVDRTQCKTLAWEMREGYRWPEHKSEVRNDSEKPLDKDNHATEALGRFFRGYFGGTELEKRRPRQTTARTAR